MFKKEERLNLMLVNKALLHPKEFNIEELQQQFEEEDEEIERQREQERQIKAELEESQRQQKMSKKLQLHENKMRNPKKRVSKSARVMLDGERLDKAERLQKETKPKRKRRKAAPQGQPVKREAIVSKRKFTITSDAEDDDAFEDAADNSPGLDESDHEHIADVRDVEVENAPYVPNGEFTLPAPSPISPSLKPVASKSKLPEVPVSDIPLDINSMDIDVVDEESRSLYEIKAEPKVFPVQIYGNGTKNTDPPNVITLQNLDDHSQTTVAYREPKVCTDLIVGDQQDHGIDSVESKYYGGCDVVYIPMPANAPIAHPVKTEMYPQPTQLSVPPPLQSPPLHYDLHPVSEPASVTGINMERQTIKKIVEALPKPDPVTVPEPQPDPEVEMPKPVIEDLPQPLLVPSKVEQEQTVEEDDTQPVPEEGEPEEPRGLGPLEDIDINSLVLVESQDTTNPDRTIYEIYVIDPETGKLSEKPLDVPEDVIENIRSILEVGED